MIIWIASYPKSGNTLVRSMLAAYFFSKDGVYDFPIIKNIKQFPHGGLFKKYGIKIENQKDVIKNYINIQKTFCQNNSIQFLKTHSYLFKEFTTLENTLGVIYIVRDPRNTLLSLTKYLNRSIEEALKYMKLGEGDGLTWTGNWSKNYQSWKELKNHEKYFLVKYEDLVLHREEVFLNILRFIHNLKKTKLSIDQEKFKNTIRTTSFEYLKELENKKGFSESNIDSSTGKKIPFFDKGPNRDWRNTLDQNNRKDLEVFFKDQMLELGYL